MRIHLILILLLIQSLNAQKFNDSKTNLEYKIPIVFHVLDNNLKDGDIPDEEFFKLVELINRNFNQPNSDFINPLYYKDSETANVSFFIPEKSKNGDLIDPITWTYSNKEFYKISTEGDYPLIDVHKPTFENNEYLNIYLTKLENPQGSIRGYHKLKTIFGEEGIVVDWSLFFRPQQNLNGIPNSISQGVKELNPMAFALTHEIGHFFNLNHTWGAKNIIFNGCQIATQKLWGDFVEDTPIQYGPNEAYKSKRYNPITKIWTPIPNCNSSNPSNYQNFMDYGYGVPNGYGMFTKGQVARMRENIKTKRTSLLWNSSNSNGLQSILSNTKQRDKFGTRMIVNNLYPHGTITDRDMVELFNSIGIIPTSENLRKLGLKIIANDKFKDLGTGKEVNQDYIFKYLDLNKAKSTYSNISLEQDIPEKEKTFVITYKLGFVNPNFYGRKVVLTNKSTKEQYIIDIQKAGYNYGDKKITWSNIPFGTYNCEVYTTFTKKKIRSFDVSFLKDKQQINLIKNGYN